MAKCIYTPAVLSTLKTVASNGSIIAQLIVEELEADNEMASKSACNYFDIKFTTSEGRQYYTITACCKDVTNPNFPDHKNPKAAWDPKHRQEIGVNQFISRFSSIRQGVKVDKTIPEIEIQTFQDLLSIPTLHIVKGNTYKDFLYAYDGRNYAANHSENILHNSCMRHETTARNAADFYANCAHTQILYVLDDKKKVYGRAILWEGIMIDGKKETFVDRIYYTDRAVMTMIVNMAKQYGWLKKEINSYDSKEQFMRYSHSTNNWAPFRTNKAYWPLTDCAEYKEGCPYMDTLSYGVIKNGVLALTNDRNQGSRFADCCSTNGYASGTGLHFCPICGKQHDSNTGICPNCQKNFTFYGSVLVPKHITTYNGENIPAEFLDKDGNLRPMVVNVKLISKMTRV